MFTQRRYGTSFPGNMALGAAQNESWSEEASYASARELQALGINIDFAPVVDVNVNPNNPIVGIRSFGENSKEVAKHARRATRGYLRGGVFPVPKHFPGHGDTHVDSHGGLPVIQKTLSEMLCQELLPFKASISAGAPLMMSAHILFPRLDLKYPATFSKKILGDLLRQKLGFNGVVVSDGLDMGAIANQYDIGKACVLALEGGCDLLLIGTADFRAAFQAVLVAVRSGRLSGTRVHEAFLRVAALKKRILGGVTPAIRKPGSRLNESLDSGFRRNDGFTRLEKNRELAERIAEQSVTLLRDENALLPLSLNKKETLLFISLCPPQFASEKNYFMSQLRRRHRLTRVFDLKNESPALFDQVFRQAGKADCLVIGTFSWGNLPTARCIRFVQKLLKAQKRAVLVSLMNPYDLVHYPEAKTVVSTYGVTRPAFESTTKLLFGEIIPRGRLPVSIPGAFSKGAGLNHFNRR